MISNLLGTKLHQPIPTSRRIQRPDLLLTLTDNLAAGRLLTLVSAPAGFGKTTLVSEWVSNIHLPVTWLSLDRTDDDPSQFFAYLIAALQKVHGNIGREIESVMLSGQLPPLPAIAASLINDILAGSVPFILVLDDFQAIQDRAILEVLETLLANPPEQLHLVLITREDPRLPLGRLRANNQMTEIRAEDLRFSEREVDLFLNGIMGLALSEGDITALENRTEGWAAGLQLAAIAMQGQADLSGFISHLGGSHRYILSYLTEEVLNRQTEDIQIFLLQTSILDKLCGGLCDGVTGRLGSQALLEKCYHANLFLIPLDDEGCWYRYHHLFRDLLLNQQSHIPKQDILELHRRASQWYEGAAMIGESVEHALAAEDYQHAVQLLEGHSPRLIMQGYLKTVEGWMQALPSEWQSHNPRANLAFAWMYLLRGSYEKVKPYLKRARQAIWEIDPVDESSKSLRSEWLSLQSTFVNIQGEAEQSIALANQALEWAGIEDYYVKSLAYAALGGGYRLTGNYTGSIEAYQQAIQNSRAGGHPVPEMLAVSGLMVMAIQHGQLRFAYETGTQALERLEREGAIYSPMAGTVCATLGHICYEWNQLEKASNHLLRSIQLNNLSGHNAGVVYAKICQALVFQALGDSRTATKTIQEVVDLLPLGLPAWLKPEVAAHLARFYLDQGNPTTAEAVLLQLGLSISERSAISDPLTNPEGLKYLLSLRLLLHRVREGQGEQEHIQGIDLAGCLIDRAMSAQLIAIALQALLLRAQMVALRGNMEASLADLHQAVELAEQEGYMRTFLDEGPAIVALLELSLKQPSQPGDRQTGFIRQLLVPSAATGPVPSPGESPIRPGLSQGRNPWVSPPPVYLPTVDREEDIGLLEGGEAAFEQPKPLLVKAVPIRPETPVLEEMLIEPLTDREMDVLRLMAEGLKYKDIAERLFITLNTVRFYVKEIYSKLNANNRTQAIETAHKHKLL